jgi:nucleoside-diphosphate-sugar epimerase
LNPNSFHGIAQLTREFIFQNSNLKSLAILRCSSIYGLEDTHTSYGPNRFFKSALQSEIIKVFGKGLNKRDHVYIDDVISIIDKVSKCKFTGVLNIASGDSLTFLEVANMVVDVFNSKSKIIFSGDEGDIREKNFDISKLINTFPDHKITELRKGLTLMKNQIE